MKEFISVVRILLVVIIFLQLLIAVRAINTNQTQFDKFLAMINPFTLSVFASTFYILLEGK